MPPSRCSRPARQVSADGQRWTALCLWRGPHLLSASSPGLVEVSLSQLSLIVAYHRLPGARAVARGRRAGTVAVRGYKSTYMLRSETFFHSHCPPHIRLERSESNNPPTLPQPTRRSTRVSSYEAATRPSHPCWSFGHHCRHPRVVQAEEVAGLRSSSPSCCIPL